MSENLSDLSFILPLDSEEAGLEIVGGKAANLSEISRAGFPVPDGYFVTTAAYDLFLEENDLKERIDTVVSNTDTMGHGEMKEASSMIRGWFSSGDVPERIAIQLIDAYRSLGSPPVAVRSSATAEDLPGMSFAGQQDTFLNIRGEVSLVKAVLDCWSSLWTPRAIGYRTQQGIGSQGIKLAVIVQKMVKADVAGVIFTANPISGARDEMVITAAWGLGESIVGGLVNPDTLIIDKASGHIISRDISSKDVMTIYSGVGTEEVEVSDDKKRLPVLTDSVAATLAQYGVKIEKHYKTPMDIEWALYGGEIAILQARPITALPDPVEEIAFDWDSVPAEKRLYMRASIAELLPDPLSPLFASMAMETVSKATNRIGLELLKAEVYPVDVFHAIHGYAYYYMPTDLKTMWAMISRSFNALRLMFMDVERRWREESRPKYAGVVAKWKSESLDGLTASQLIRGVDDLLESGAEYYTTVQLIMPNAVASELVFNGYYNRLVKKKGDPPALTYLIGFDSLPIRAEKSLFDLAVQARQTSELEQVFVQKSLEDLMNSIWEGDTQEGVSDGIWEAWCSAFQKHLDLYGHTIYDLDFMKPVPADDPLPLLDTIRYYIQGEGANPHERQDEVFCAREEAIEVVMKRLKGPRRKYFDKILRWAHKNVPLREESMADIGLGWPRLRQMVFELGQRFVSVGVIEAEDDIFWLMIDEVKSLAEKIDRGGEKYESLQENIHTRQSLWKAQKRIIPPSILPRNAKLLGINVSRWLPNHEAELEGDMLKGLGASPGQVTARACVINGPEDFGKMTPGGVLVANITTPAWTPLFTIASAIVTDVGGVLSHSSIVAREYRIPAVLGTGVGTHQIQHGQMVCVDGDAGTVKLLNGD